MKEEQATLQQVLAFIDADNKANSRDRRGQFKDDIAQYVCDAMANMTNEDARYLLDKLEVADAKANAVICDLLERVLLNTYSDAALKHDENVKARERAWRVA